MESEKKEEALLSKSKIKGFLKESFETITTALILTFVIYYFISTPNQVQGQSMLPNVNPNELILTNRIKHHLSKTPLATSLNQTYQRGDVIIFKLPNQEAFIKRIIALPGDEIGVCENNLIIDDKIVKEAYIPSDQPTFPADFLRECEIKKIPDGSYAVFGDNRQHSLDSRSSQVGFVRQEYFIGPAFLRILPLEKFGILKKGEYQESPIPEELKKKLTYDK
ncbi:signal peptidase I [Candidatus Dojkabacteria bacterium]|nr:signal peptidase I [Candidatus Dojkabacteria bacterium]